MAVRSITELRGLASVSILLSGMGAAEARSLDLGRLSEQLIPQIVAVGQAINYGMAAAGIFFVGSGLFKLKVAADSNGQQVGYGQGVWRLVVGSGLLAVPAIIGVLQNTFGVSGAAMGNFFGF